MMKGNFPFRAYQFTVLHVPYTPEIAHAKTVRDCDCYCL